MGYHGLSYDGATAAKAISALASHCYSTASLARACLSGCHGIAGFHASTSFIGPNLINNTFLNNGDDGIAIHGRYYLVVAVQTYDPLLHCCLAALLSH